MSRTADGSLASRRNGASCGPAAGGGGRGGEGWGGGGDCARAAAARGKGGGGLRSVLARRTVGAQLAHVRGEDRVTRASRLQLPRQARIQRCDRALVDNAPRVPRPHVPHDARGPRSPCGQPVTEGRDRLGKESRARRPIPRPGRVGRAVSMGLDHALSCAELELTRAERGMHVVPTATRVPCERAVRCVTRRAARRSQQVRCPRLHALFSMLRTHGEQTRPPTCQDPAARARACRKRRRARYGSSARPISLRPMNAWSRWLSLRSRGVSA